jgi:GAF domain-containing protein
MAKTRIPKNDDRLAFENKVRGQYAKLFSGNEELPSPLGIRQVEALKARVAELEKELEKLSAVVKPSSEPSSVSVVEIPPSQKEEKLEKLPVVVQPSGKPSNVSVSEIPPSQLEEKLEKLPQMVESSSETSSPSIAEISTSQLEEKLEKLPAAVVEPSSEPSSPSIAENSTSQLEEKLEKLPAVVEPSSEPSSVSVAEISTSQLEEKLEKLPAVVESSGEPSNISVTGIPNSQPEPADAIGKDWASAIELPPAKADINDEEPITVSAKAAEDIEKVDSSQENKETGVATALQRGFVYNAMVVQLRNAVADLEKRVAERTHDLELAWEVGRRVTEQTTDLYVLLNDAVDLIRERFNLYYTQIYLTDATGRTLILRAGTGEVGAELLRRRHQLLIDSKSINGRAAADKRAQVMTNSEESANFLPNPLLPNTHSEISIPLMFGEQVLGVLNMQSDQPGAFNETQLPAFTGLASQLAIAIQNASLLAEVQQAHSEMQSQVRRLTGQGWQEFLNAIEHGQRMGFAFDQQTIVPLKANALFERATENTLDVPISVTGEQIGFIQLGDEPTRAWTSRETEIVEATARQLALHIENLRLLGQADRYRNEAEQAARRLTHEGWDAFLQSRDEQASGYVFDLNQVQPLAERSNSESGRVLKYPLVVRDEAVGELIVDSVTQSDEAAEIIEAVAQQLSAHIEDLRLTAQTENALNETETLYKASAELNTAKTYDQILEVLRRYTWLGHNTQNVTVSLFDRPWSSEEEPTWIKTMARWTLLPPTAVLDQYPVSAFPSARELLHPNTPTLIEDVASDPRLDDNARNLYAVQFGAKSTLFIPLVVGGQWLGYLNGIYQQATTFPEAEIRKLVAVSGQAAVAINNIRLLLLTQERVKREQSLREITAAVRSSTNPVTIMRTAVREIGNMLGRKTVLQLSAPEQSQQTESTANDGNESVPPAIQSS